MKKLVVVPALLKAHVGSYTRKDGTFVQEHDDKRQAAASKPSTPDDVKKHAVSAGAKFKANVSVFSKPDLAHSFAEQTKGSKGGAFVMKHPDHDHHVVVSGADAQRMEKNGYQHAKPGASPKLVLPKKAAPKPTGSAAPAKMVNAGSEKWPMHVKSSEKLATKREDGSTHHVGGFKPPEYPAGGGATDGDVTIHHDGKTYSHTGKKGKNMKTGEDSYEYSHSDDRTESRAWVTRSGHLMND